MILPHRRLPPLTGDFRAKGQRSYLTPDEDDEWNAMVHLSNWPLPKPWRHLSDSEWQSLRPECPEDEEQRDDRLRHADRVMWEGFYE